MGEVCSLGIKLSEQAVSVFIAATLPRGIRIREVECQTELIFYCRVTGKLLTTVGRAGSKGPLWQRFKQLADGLFHRG